MSMKQIRGTLLVSLTVAVALVLVGGVLFRYWINPVIEQPAGKARPAGLVDDQPLLTAQKLAALATTAEEQEFAQNALRVADHEVDMAFAAALHQATEHAPPIPAAAKPILATVEGAERRVKADQQEIARLKQQLAKAEENAKPTLQDRMDLVEATLEVDQEDLDALRQELIRAGGDPRSKIQQLEEQHEALDHEQSGVQPQHAQNPRAPGAPASAQAESVAAAQERQSRILMVQFRSWRQLSMKETELAAARDELKGRMAALGREHQALDEETREAAAEPDQHQHEHEPAAAQTGGTPAGTGKEAQEKFAALRHAAQERKHLAELDKRAADFQQLDGIYNGWAALVRDRKHGYLMGVVEGASWVLVLVLVLVFANRLVHGAVARVAPDSRRRHTVRIAVRFAVQVMALILILVVVFGPPSQLATVLALAGAGLTVALKDFIVGFFGWFILMGPNGIRPGDWVEINGIGGEVVEVGPLHTVILETGDWSDAGHPTGRKVTVVNSFAIEGHYFNFSTAGQWLWEQIEAPIPAGVDPYPIAEAVQKIVLAETKDDTAQAEQEWERAVPGHVGRTFSPGPAIMVRPTTLGVNVVVRYITRANKRHEVRSRIFHKVVELLRSRHIASAPIESETHAAKTE
jgi:small-conductance mechanosensitive channel